MKRCAFLSMDSLDDFVCYDHLLHQPLAERGWSVDTLPWRHPDIDWDTYDAVLIRSPWDYQQDADAFIKLLERIEASSARLENSLELVKWNIRKTYLRDLEQAGIDIVPTLWAEGLDERLSGAVEKLGSPRALILKPQVSANADDTFRIAAHRWPVELQQLKPLFDRRPLMLQPYLPAIEQEGEFSLFYFGGAYSHAILKTPASGDFRVQEEHGGRLLGIEPDATLRSVADRVLDGISRLLQEPLYARVDLVRDGAAWRLMEVELIEPSLYFNMDPLSAARFAEAFERRMARAS
jgi:glutathione synthase/RimK-type ligase-like ATP-grasp enzyme